ncbi:hypothetical protein HHI36_006861 [Cryptolaemus montrouzieri]|uniref:Uncharacterized protein n=1 Tax=Cryptolaemus montrouzieri TaxID=559131 RepID=A0ABD2MN18_9CUCU
MGLNARRIDATRNQRKPERSPDISQKNTVRNAIRCDDSTGRGEFAVNVGSLSECYFAGKGTALVLPDAEASTSPQRGSSGGQRPSVTGTNIQKHLQSMFYLLRPEETLKMYWARASAGVIFARGQVGHVNFRRDTRFLVASQLGTV